MFIIGGICDEEHIKDHNGFLIKTAVGVEYGIFFRHPIQKVDFDACCEDNSFNAWRYLEQIKNPFRKLYEILIGNKHIVDNIKQWSLDYNWGGFKGNILCSPVYFKRNYRELYAENYSNDDSNIEEVYSYGYEREFDYVSGSCDTEYTSIKFKGIDKEISLERKGEFHFTYEHVIEQLIDSNEL